MRNTTLWLLVAIPCFAIGTSAGARCLSYEPARVTIEGELTTRLVPGPPGYVSIGHGDHPETIVIVVLDEPICVVADPGSRFNSKTYTKITEVQLALEGKPYRHLVGKRVRATGSLFQANSRHHRTPVVLTTKGLRSL